MFKRFKWTVTLVAAGLAISLLSTGLTLAGKGGGKPPKDDPPPPEIGPTTSRCDGCSSFPRWFAASPAYSVRRRRTS